MTDFSRFDISSIGLNPNEFDIVNTLLRNTSNVFIVGGAVRDLFLGETPKDFDVATDLRPERVLNIFGPNAKMTGKVFPTVRVKKGDSEIEISTFRKEIGIALNGDKNSCEFHFADNIIDDLARRDLVVNAIAIHAKTGEVVDPFGGIDDINTRTIRFVEDPQRRIAEDPNRLLRALRFRLKLDGTFDIDTKNALSSEESRILFLDNTPKEQIREEILKGLKTTDTFSRFFEDLNDIGLLNDLFPELHRMIDLDGGRHHNETVFVHSMLTGDAFEITDKNNPKEVLGKLAAFLHDIGKFVSFDPEKRNFIGHADTGAELVVDVLSRFRFSNDEIAFVKKLVGTHMRFPDTMKGARKLVSEFGDDIWILFKLFRADVFGNTSKRIDEQERALSRIEEIENFVKEIFEEKDSFIKLAVNGHDLISEFNLKPGKIIGQLLNVLKETVFNDPTTNSRDFLLKVAEEQLACW